MGCKRLKNQNFSFLEIVPSEKSVYGEKKRVNYYPFGLKHKGYNNVVTSEHKWKYNGKELQGELDLNWYDLGARNLDHALGRFMNVDPRAEDYNFQSVYAFAANNPILYIDINGEGVDWIPEVDKKGNISYVAESGDSANSLKDQYGLTQSNAESITNSKGSEAIKEGTKISGKKVNEVTKAGEVLKLDTTNENTTDSDIANQTMFAVRNENIQDGLGNGGEDGITGSGNIYDYFSTNSIHSNNGATYGFGTNHRKPISFNLGNGENALISVSIGQSNNGRFSIFVGGDRQVLIDPKKDTYRRHIDFNYPRSKNQATSGIKSLTGRVITISVHSGNGNYVRDYLDGK